MADPTPIPAAPTPAPAPTQTTTTVTKTTTTTPENYLFTVAAKKVAWALTKMAVAFISTPAIVAGFTKLSALLATYGITLQVNTATLSTALPPLIFGLLVLAHDWAKVKYGVAWL